MARNRLLAALIVLASVAFAIGIALEKNDAHPEGTAEATHSESDEATHVEGVEEATGAAEATEGAGESQSESSENEKLLGIDLESTPFVVLAIVVSLALAAGVWLRPDTALVLVVAVAMLAFAVLDVREVVHQLDESNEGWP